MLKNNTVDVNDEFLINRSFSSKPVSSKTYLHNCYGVFRQKLQLIFQLT